MKNKIYLLLTIVFCLSLSCTKNIGEKNSFSVIDIENNINNFKEIQISDLSKDIKYISLESTANLELSSISNMDISSDYILVSDRRICLLFDSKGNFISKIGVRGNGPEEYQFISNIALGPNGSQKVYIQSSNNLIEYTLNGTYIKRYSGLLKSREERYIESWHFLTDSLIFANIPNSTGSEQNKAQIFNLSGKIKTEFKNYDISPSEMSGGNMISEFAHIYEFDDVLWFKQYFNDTLFYLNQYYQLIPKFVFLSGNLKIPVSDRLKFPIGDILWSHKTIFDVYQTKNLLFVKFLFGHNFPARRITPIVSSFPGQPEIWINTNYVLGLCNKESLELRLCKPTSTDNPLFTSGIYNDFDCGPRFFPTLEVNDSTLLMTIEPKKLKDHVTSNDFKDNAPMFPDKKKQLEDFANELSLFDNPVLMLVIFK